MIFFQNTANCMFASHNHKGRRGRDHMVVGFLTAYAISDSGSWRGVLDTNLCDKVFSDYGYSGILH